MKRASIAAALLMALAACGGPVNTDPRRGRVVLDEENCLSGDCYLLAEICIGPDLHVFYDEMGDDDYTRVIEDAAECEVTE